MRRKLEGECRGRGTGRPHTDERPRPGVLLAVKPEEGVDENGCKNRVMAGDHRLNVSGQIAFRLPLRMGNSADCRTDLYPRNFVVQSRLGETQAREEKDQR